MKRHITKLEQKLIEYGFTLASKTYKGKDSKRTHNYVYVGEMENYRVVIYLDYKREKLDHFVIENTLPRYIGLENLDSMERVYREISTLIYGE